MKMMLKIEKIKQVILAIIFIQLFSGCNSNQGIEHGFVVMGRFSQIDEPIMVRLSYTDDSNRRITDEVVAEKGEFTFTGETVASAAELLFFPYDPDHAITTSEYWTFAAKAMKEKKYFENASRSFLLENGSFKFVGKDDLAAARLETNSENQELYSIYKKEFASLNKRYFDLSEQRELDSIGSDTDQVESLEKSMKEQQLKITDYAYEFAAKYPSSLVTLVALKGDGVNINLEKLGFAINNLSKELQATPVFDHFREMVETAKKNGIGSRAIEFTLEDVQGNKRSLSSFSGKYVLVDFWASWCAPCRAENPNVLNAYDNFKKDNFDVISISIDQDKNAWLEAVKEDGLPWLNLIDGKTATESVAKAYGVLAVPSNFLINPEGTIVAKNLRGAELQKKLAEILK